MVQQPENTLVQKPAEVMARNKAAKRQKAATAAVDSPCAYEKKRNANVAQNDVMLASLGLIIKPFSCTELAKTHTELEYNDILFQVGQRVAVYFNDEFGWLLGRISAIQKKAKWVQYDGEEDEFNMGPNSKLQQKHGKTWTFVTESAKPHE